MLRSLLAGFILSGFLIAPAHAEEVSLTLRGSPGSMVRQHEVAVGQGLIFVETAAEVRELEQSGELVRLSGNGDYEIAEFVSYPVARAELRLFIERLAAQYHEATGEKLVVTSLTRPSSDQPRNSHALSVHPTGIAVDLRVSGRTASREWLESTLLSLEEQGMLDVTRERNPPHYHVALFPDNYLVHVEKLEAQERKRLAAEEAMANLASVSAFASIPESDSPDEDAPLAVLLGLIVAIPVGGLAVVHRLLRRSKG